MISILGTSVQPGEWLTASEAAERLRLPSVRALYQRVARGQIKAYRLGRSLRFRRREVDSAVSHGRS